MPPAPGALAVHRWFADGEGWHVHSSFDGCILQLGDAALQILAGPQCEVEIPALGGWLIGEVVPDPACPDPKARLRQPAMLRLCYLPQRPDADQRSTILAKLRRRPVPTSAGSNPDWILDGFGSMIAPRARHPFFVAGAIGVLVLVAIGALTMGVRSFFRDESPEPSPAHGVVVTRPITPDETRRAEPPQTDADLVPIDGDVPYLMDRTAREFRGKKKLIEDYDHPYVAYLAYWEKRLPESASTCRTDGELRQALAALLRQVQAGESADVSAVELRKAIDRALNYESWRERAGKKSYGDREKHLDPAARRFVEQFRSPNAGFRSAIEKMAELLERWGDVHARADEAKHPFEVVARFFAMLQRPPGMPDPVTLDHPKVVFLWRLPAESAARDMAFDSADDLAMALRRLLVWLDPETNIGLATPRELVELLGERMSYGDWLQSHRRVTFRDAARPTPDAVNRACEKFR